MAKAKNFFRAGILGFILILLGWLVIHTVFWVSGYKNAGGWWQLRCEVQVQSDNSAINNSVKNTERGALKTFPNLAAFLESGKQEGRLGGIGTAQNFIGDLKNLKEGEEVTFSAPAKTRTANLLNGGSSVVTLPVLTIQRIGGKLKLSPGTATDLRNYFLAGFEDNSQFTSLINDEGKNISGETENLMNWLTGKSANLLGTSEVDSSNQDETLNYIDQAFSEISQNYQNGSSQNNDFMVSLVAQLLLKIIEMTQAILVELGKMNGIDLTVSGDRADLTDETSVNSNTDLATIPDNSDRIIGSVNVAAKNANRNTNNNIWYQQNSNKNDNLNIVVDVNSGTKVERALKRIYLRDPLRYEMVHRFVKSFKSIKGTYVNYYYPGISAYCESCGEIYLNPDEPVSWIEEDIIHESTHSANFCLGITETRAEMERMAEANEIGSLNRQACDDLDNSRNNMMREFPGQGVKVTYQGIPVRGYLSRWQTKVTPAGDSNSVESFTLAIQYVSYYGDNAMGPYHYGDHDLGLVLGLKENEEQKVEAIMGSYNMCFSKAAAGLPPAGDCEKNAPSPLIIDPGLSSP